MFIKTNEMNDPALIHQAYSCHTIYSSKRFAIALMEIKRQAKLKICEFRYLHLLA